MNINRLLCKNLRLLLNRKQITVIAEKFSANRNIHSTDNKFQLPKTPDLIYVPHITRWVKTKLRFKYLQKRWDPEFSEGAFIYGSTHAICRITEIINNGHIEQLNGLLTASATSRLINEITRLSQTQQKIIKLEPKDIKIYIPLDVIFNNNDKSGKECIVGLRILALKWQETSRSIYRLVLVAIQTEFIRNYSTETKPDWTICNFNILECAILTETPNPR